MTIHYDGPDPFDFGDVPESRLMFKGLKFKARDNFAAPAGGSGLIVEIAPQGALGAFTLQGGSGWTPVAGGAFRSAAFSLSAGGFKDFEFFISVQKTGLGPTAATIVVRVINSGQPDKIVDLDANIVVEPLTRLALVLDRSLSMANATTSSTRTLRMREAAEVCLPLLNDLDELALVAFNNVGASPVAIGPLDGNIGGITRREKSSDVLQDTSAGSPLTPTAQTSILCGVQQSHVELGAPGIRHALYLSDGLNDIGSTTGLPTLPGEQRYAVGLVDGMGALDQLRAKTHLGNVAGSNAILLWKETADAAFKLEKYVTQVVLGATGSSVLLDPDATLTKDRAHEYEVTLTEADHSFDVICLSEKPELLRVRVEPVRGRPHGNFLTHDGTPTSDVANDKDREYDDKCCREEEQRRKERRDKCGPEQEGRKPLRHFEPSYAKRAVVYRLAAFANDAQRPTRYVVRITAPRSKERLPYSLVVASKSDLKLDAQLHASDLYVGSELLFSAVVTQFERTLKDNVQVEVELMHPDGDVQKHRLEQTRPGRFTLRIPTFRPGIYEARFIARGESLFGAPFRRELLATEHILPASVRLGHFDLAAAPASAAQLERDKRRE